MRYDKETAGLNITGSDVQMDAAFWEHVSEDEPLKYQAGVLHMIMMQGQMKMEDADIMALQFFAPIYMLLTVCDREPEREAEALVMLEKHIKQFNRMYKE